MLRGVAVQGQMSLPRPRRAGDAGTPARLGPAHLVPMPTGKKAEAGPPVPSTHQVAPEPRQALQGLAAAQAEEQARRQGYEEGFAQGCAEGRAQGSEQVARELEAHAERMGQELRQQAQAAYQARVQVLDGLMAALPAQIEARLAAAEDDMLALCFEVVCRVLGESAARPEVIRMQLARAIEGLRGKPLVAVHLHPEDLAALQKEPGSAATRPGGAEVQWIASSEVALGGCILQTPEGGLDARLETQLQGLRDLLQHQRAAARASSSVPAVTES